MSSSPASASVWSPLVKSCCATECLLDIHGGVRAAAAGARHRAWTCPSPRRRARSSLAASPVSGRDPYVGVAARPHVGPPRRTVTGVADGRFQSGYDRTLVIGAVHPTACCCALKSWVPAGQRNAPGLRASLRIDFTVFTQ